MRPHRRQLTRLPRPWDSPGKNSGVGCHFLLQCMKVKSESEIAQWCPTHSDPMDCGPPGSCIHGILQARVLEWGAIAFSVYLEGTSYLALLWCQSETINHHHLQSEIGFRLGWWPYSCNRGKKALGLLIRVLIPKKKSGSPFLFGDAVLETLHPAAWRGRQSNQKGRAEKRTHAATLMTLLTSWITLKLVWPQNFQICKIINFLIA